MDSPTHPPAPTNQHTTHQVKDFSRLCAYADIGPLPASQAFTSKESVVGERKAARLDQQVNKKARRIVVQHRGAIIAVRLSRDFG